MDLLRGLNPWHVQLGGNHWGASSSTPDTLQLSLKLIAEMLRRIEVLASEISVRACVSPGLTTSSSHSALIPGTRRRESVRQDAIHVVCKSYSCSLCCLCYRSIFCRSSVTHYPHSAERLAISTKQEDQQILICAFRLFLVNTSTVSKPRCINLLITHRVCRCTLI